HALEKLTIHEVEKDDGLQWERVTASYEAQGFSEIKTEARQEYSGNPVTKATLTSADPNMSAKFDNQVADLANFLGWMAEPNQLQRKQMGVWILLFLSIFLVVAWRLNAAYWKHVK